VFGRATTTLGIGPDSSRYCSAAVRQRLQRIHENSARHLSVSFIHNQMTIFGDLLGPAFAASRVQHISDLYSKFALGPHHVSKYGRNPISDG